MNQSPTNFMDFEENNYSGFLASPQIETGNHMSHESFEDAFFGESSQQNIWSINFERQNSGLFSQNNLNFEKDVQFQYGTYIPLN